MEHSVLSDRLTIGIGKKWKRIPSRLAELLGLGRRIHTDSHDFKATLVKLVQVLLETPQLGVAEWSPVSAIENEHKSAMSLQKIGG